MKPYIETKIIDKSLDKIALQGGRTAVVAIQEWQENPLAVDDYFANFAMNAWDNRYFDHQDSDFCTKRKPSFDDIDWDNGFACQNAQATIDDVGIQSIVLYALYWQNDAYYRQFVSKTRHNALMRAYRRLCKQYYFAPLGLYVHSTMQFYTGIHQDWDNSAIGFVAIHRSVSWENKPRKYSDTECETLADNALVAYNAYANGEIMCIYIEDDAEDEIIETHENFFDWSEIKPFLDANYGLMKEAA